MRTLKLSLALSILSVLSLGQINSTLARADGLPKTPAVSEPPANAEKIDVAKLPKVVVDGVKKAMPGARITKAAKVVEEGKTVYYLDDVKVGKVGWDVTVSAEGKILKKEECHDE